MVSGRQFGCSFSRPTKMARSLLNLLVNQAQRIAGKDFCSVSIGARTFPNLRSHVELNNQRFLSPFYESGNRDTFAQRRPVLHAVPCRGVATRIPHPVRCLVSHEYIAV